MTVRQDTQPIQFGFTRRMDNTSIRTSGPAGVSIPLVAGPIFRGDSVAGRVLIDAELAEMPKPLENAVIAKAQFWVVPRPALPQFEGLDEYTHSYHGKTISRLGAAARSAPALFDTVGTGAIAAAQSSEFFKALGISLVAATAINTDYIDAYVLIYNFRLAAHTSKATRADYYQEDAVAALELKPAFWPRNRMFDIVADYELALQVGNLDLDIASGSIPVGGIGVKGTAIGTAGSTTLFRETDGTETTKTGWEARESPASAAGMAKFVIEEGTTGYPAIYAEMAGQTIATTLANLDAARKTQAFAKRVAAMAGSDFSGFNNDDVVISELMQGFNVPPELQNRPWLVDSKTAIFGMSERHATDAANLDDSVTTGRVQMSLSVNIPKMEYGGVYLCIFEITPERLFERQGDPYLYITDADGLPNAMRDVLRTDGFVDTVPNWRIDALHSSPTATYGYEPMNAKHQREFTRLGGEFRQTTPGTPITTARTAIWQPDVVDPAYTLFHHQVPHPFPADVFSAPSADVVNISAVAQLTMTGITQFGEPLVEDNSEFSLVEAE